MINPWTSMAQFSSIGNSNEQVLKVCLEYANEDVVIANYMH